MTLDPKYLWRQGRAVLNARWYLRKVDVVGERVRVRGCPVIVNRGRIVIGERVQINSTIATTELVTEPDGTMEIGASALVNFGCSLVATHRLVIGANCQIGPYTMMLDNGYHRVEPERRLERPPSEPIVLGENVWIGARVIVMPGVTIGTDSCIGAGSVVTHDIPPRALAAGVPARVIKSL